MTRILRVILTAVIPLAGISSWVTGCSSGPQPIQEVTYPSTAAGNALKACDAWVLAGFNDRNVSAGQRKKALDDAQRAATSAAARDKSFLSLSAAIQKARDEAASSAYNIDSIKLDGGLLGTIADLCRDAGQAP